MKAENHTGTVMPDISFITTVYNEEENIIDFLKSLMEQTCLPCEIIVVDGGSEDKTFDIALKFFKYTVPLRYSGLKIIFKGNNGIETKRQNGQKPVINVRLIRKAETNIAQGRNEAIRKATGSIICVSDAGCVLDRDWLKEITAFYGDGSFNVVGGLNLPLCGSFIQKCLAVCIMPAEKEIKAGSYMPSSRNISFSRDIWTKTGGYPEDMEYGEDMRFNFNIKAGGHKIKFNPKAVVYWRMRKNPVQIFKQFFRYAKGDAAGGMYPIRHIIRFTALFTFLVILLAAFYFSIWILAAFIPLFLLYVFRPYARLLRNRDTGSNCSFKRLEKLLSIPVIPFLLLQIDFSKMCGYVYGAFRKI
jgi:glycosyltransferase involved in cell wall biosynthesis